MVRIVVTVREDQADRLYAKVGESGKSMSETVRELIDSVLAGPVDAQAVARGRRAMRTRKGRG